jgi:Zn-dependent peptidase ImmA (M78 family)
MSFALHRYAGDLAGQAERMLTQGQTAEAATLYLQAARIESQVLADIPAERPKTRAVLAVSSLALFLKAAAYEEGLEYGTHVLSSEPPLPDFAIPDIQELVNDLRLRRDQTANRPTPSHRISPAEVRRRAGRAGVPRDLFNRLLDASGSDLITEALARAFGWAPQAIVEGVPSTAPPPMAVQFKATRRAVPLDSPLLALAFRVSALVNRAVDLEPYSPISKDPRQTRSQVIADRGGVTLESLLHWSWTVGIPVVPLHGSGTFVAAAWQVASRPVVVIKDTRPLSAYWLFDLAHELGHIALGHTANAGIIDIDSPQPQRQTDSQEQEANAFALDLLIPGSRDLVRSIRTDAAGNYLWFKGAVERTASRAGVSAGLLGMIAAYEMTDLGRYKDRWGSATNLAKSEGPGRPSAEAALRSRLTLQRLPDMDQDILRASTLSEVLDQPSQ